MQIIFNPSEKNKATESEAKQHQLRNEKLNVGHKFPSLLP